MILHFPGILFSIKNNSVFPKYILQNTKLVSQSVPTTALYGSEAICGLAVTFL